MAGLVRKSLNSPEETRPFEGGTGQLELVNLAAGAVGRATFQPGWRWSEHIKPIAKTDSCQAAHMGYFISGRMKVVMDDGEQMEFGPGDFSIIPPGHDAWIVGNEPCVVIDWQGFTEYAKRLPRAGPVTACTQKPAQLRLAAMKRQRPSRVSSGFAGRVTQSACGDLLDKPPRGRWDQGNAR